MGTCFPGARTGLPQIGPWCGPRHDLSHFWICSGVMVQTCTNFIQVLHLGVLGLLQIIYSKYVQKKIHQTARTLRRCRGLCLRRFPWTPGGPGCESKKICAGPPSLLWAESAQMEHQGCRLMQMTQKLRIVNLSNLLIIKPSWWLYDDYRWLLLSLSIRSIIYKIYKHGIHTWLWGLGIASPCLPLATHAIVAAGVSRRQETIGHCCLPRAQIQRAYAWMVLHHAAQWLLVKNWSKHVKVILCQDCRCASCSEWCKYCKSSRN